MPLDPVDRRPLLKVIVGGAAALGVVGVGSRVYLHRDDEGGPGDVPALVLSADDGSDVESLSVPLGDALLPAAGSGRWESAQLPTTTHSMVALTWPESVQGRAAKPHVRIRSRRSGRWGEWQRVPLLHDRPDPGTGEGRGVTGTDLVWIGRSDGIQVQVRGGRPDDLRLLLLHPRPQARDRAPLERAAPLAMRGATAAVVRPDVLNRVDWGADESWRSGTPQLCTTIEQVHVHHTVTRNDYGLEDVPALIRGMYRYHTKTLGWSDIAYNFLVDRFGRIWTGRAGGAARPIRGAHTLGFNATSAGVSAIGNFDQVAPTEEMLTSIASVAAWKLDLYARDPLGTALVASEGSDKFGRGRSVALPVLDGHRDTNDTSCPGGLLYAALPSLRTRARAAIDAAVALANGPVAVTAPAAVSGVPALGQTLTVNPGSFDPPTATATFAWTRDGVPVAGASGPTYVVTGEDVGHAIAVQVAAAADARAVATQTAAVAGPVTAPGVVAVEVTARRRRAAVKVSVTAPAGVSTPAEGQVRIRWHEREKLVTLSGGRGRARFRHLKPGRYRFSAVYSGFGNLTTARSAAVADVR